MWFDDYDDAPGSRFRGAAAREARMSGEVRMKSRLLEMAGCQT
jgi:hypothetical protein